MKRVARAAADLVSSGRHTLAAFPDGGVLLDEETGGLYELNPTGLLIWEGILRHGSPQRAAEALVQRYGISPDHAHSDVADATAAVAVAPSVAAVGAEVVPMRFGRAADGSYHLVRGTDPLVALDFEAQEVRAVGPLPEGPVLEAAFRTVAAKFLSRDGFVLHASAVQIGDQLIAFVGASGAGKTTTARLIAAAGASPGSSTTCQLVSEDLVILGDVGHSGDAGSASRADLADNETVAVHPGAEPAVRRWATAAAIALRQAPGRAVSCAPLREGLGAADWPLARLVFLAANRRAGHEIAQRPLSISATAALVVQNSFLSVFDPRAWRQHLENAALIAWQVHGYEATVPRGLEALAVGARRYISNSTS